MEGTGREAGLRDLRRFLICGGGPNRGCCGAVTRAPCWFGVGTLKLSEGDLKVEEKVPPVWFLSGELQKTKASNSQYPIESDTGSLEAIPA